MSLPLSDQVFDQIIHETASQGWSFQAGVLDTHLLKKMNSYFDEHRGNFHEAKVGKGKDRVRKVEIRGDYTLWIDPLDPPDELKDVVQFLENLKLKLNRSLMLGLKEYECHLSCYPPGTFYKTHIDRFGSDSTRTISFVFYLHQTWSDGQGGELMIYSREGELLKKVNPLPGALVVFLSDKFPHEVKAGAIERRSLTGWMHTKIIN